jgi:hypothetical protein
MSTELGRRGVRVGDAWTDGAGKRIEIVDVTEGGNALVTDEGGDTFEVSADVLNQSYLHNGPARPSRRVGRRKPAADRLPGE